MARYTLAVNRRFKRKDEPEADFIPCVAFGKSGEFAEKYFRKGQLVAVTGRLQVRSWDNGATAAREDSFVRFLRKERRNFRTF